MEGGPIQICGLTDKEIKAAGKAQKAKMERRKIKSVRLTISFGSRK
jgi:hypothetical protein